MKKILSFVLSILMVIAIVPVSVFMVSAEGETVELYHNDFQTSPTLNGGSSTGYIIADDKCNTGKNVMKLDGGGTWSEPVALNNNAGAITIVANVYTNNFVNQTALGINGVKVVHCGGDSVVKIGDVKTSSYKAYRQLIITVTINDLSTGVADVHVVNADGSSPVTGTATIGAISETLNLSVVAGNNSMRVLDIKVSQVKVISHTCDYETVVTPATCVAPEFAVKTCKDCGKSTSTVTGPVLGHTWGGWTKSGEASTRSCSVCSATETKTVGEIDTSKTFLALGDSLTFALNTPGTVNDSWAKKVADSLGMSNYVNKAVHGTEAYHWYSILTGEAAPNGTKYTPSDVINKGLAYDVNFDKDAMTAAIESASVVAFTLGSNDMSKGYLQWRTPEQVHNAIVGFIDAIHEINPDAVVIAVGYAYGLATTIPVESFTGSYDYFVELGSLMTETLNSDAYNSFAYYVDVSKTMSDYDTQGNDKVHPTAAGHIEMANDVIAAIASAGTADSGTTTPDPDPTPDPEPEEEYYYYKNEFDGNEEKTFMELKEAFTVSADETLTINPGDGITFKGTNTTTLPANLIVSFDFKIPVLPASGDIYIFAERTNSQTTYIKISYDSADGKFYATVNNNANVVSKVEIKANEWYTAHIVLPESSGNLAKVYIDGIYVGGITTIAIGNGAVNGWFNFFGGTFNNGTRNTASYCIDNFYASTDPADLPKEKVQDTTSREESDVYVNNFDGTKPSTDKVFLTSDVVGENGILTVAPNSNIANRFTLQDESFANAVMSFKFMIPSISEGSVMRTLFNRSTSEYWLGMSWITPENGDSYFAAYVPNNQVKYVPIEANTWYTMTALFPSTSSGKVMLFINGTYVGDASAASIDHKNGYGFNFFGQRGGTWNTSLTNTDTYCIDDLTVSSVADEALIRISGFQKTKVVDGTYNVRFTAAINGILSLQENIGFEIAAHYTDNDGANQNKSWVLNTNTVYKSISAKYGTEEITADQLGAEYLTTVAITSVDAIYDSVEFEVRPYVTVNGVKYYGTTVTVTVHPEA